MTTLNKIRNFRISNLKKGINDPIVWYGRPVIPVYIIIKSFPLFVFMIVGIIVFQNITEHAGIGVIDGLLDSVRHRIVFICLFGPVVFAIIYIMIESLFVIYVVSENGQYISTSIFGSNFSYTPAYLVENKFVIFHGFGIGSILFIEKLGDLKYVLGTKDIWSRGVHKHAHHEKIIGNIGFVAVSDAKNIQELMNKRIANV